MSEMSEIQKELEAKVFLPTTVGDSEVIDIHSPTVPLFLIPNAKGGWDRLKSTFLGHIL